MSTLHLNDSIQSVFHIAKAFARENYNPEFGPPHLLRALHKDAGLEDFFGFIGKDIYYMGEWAEVRIEASNKVSELPTDPPAIKANNLLLEAADDSRIRLGIDEVSDICLLAAIVKPHAGFTPEQLKSFPFREQDIYNLYVTSICKQATAKTFFHNGDISMPKNGNYLQKYCTDKTAFAKQKKLDPIISREAETRQIIEILGCRSKPNVIIAGNPVSEKQPCLMDLPKQ